MEPLRLVAAATKAESKQQCAVAAAPTPAMSDVSKLKLGPPVPKKAEPNKDEVVGAVQAAVVSWLERGIDLDRQV
ncbi:hypothetical protein PRIC1_011660 [Phytophthora ramorum]|uniref:uncharacterized protein n=1 Tax=Phytophthora ramorum TaxID=164328 RepID=UPI0030A12D37|nr:hypothetical protein KRP23_1745 [Phytophthora ramorum]KAH7499007.1 hypothetical protein KRP22_11305 [Phytophthora ramorum]